MGEDENTNDEIAIDGAGINFIEVLNLSAYDPVVDIVIVNVNIGKMPPQRVKRYLEGIKNNLGPMFEERGFDVIYNAVREPSIGAASMNVQSKEHVDGEKESVSIEDSKDAFDQARIIID